MLKFFRALTPSGMAHYAAWKLQGTKGEVDLTFRDGGKARLRRADFGSAYEVFANREYDAPRAIDPAGVRHIVDLGANVGMTVLYWLHTYKNARVTAFEPHPVHVGRLRANVALNGGVDRVDLHPTAAGTNPGHMALVDAGTSSTVVAPGIATNAIPVVVEDVFDTLLARPIDILKIDIEGAEFPILEDARFVSVRARSVVMEWHRTRDGRGEAWCADVMRAAGYDVWPKFDSQDHGMLWAFHGSG